MRSYFIALAILVVVLVGTSVLDKPIIDGVVKILAIVLVPLMGGRAGNAIRNVDYERAGFLIASATLILVVILA